MMSAEQVEKLAATVGILDAEEITGAMLVALVNEALRNDPVRQTALVIAKTYAGAPVLDLDDIEPELDQLCELLGVQILSADDWLGYCQDCNGSGEGMFDGSRCRTCGGSGEFQPTEH
jgi:hypothetical protein